MVVVRFVKWSGPDTAVNPGQTPSTGYMRMLVFRNWRGRTPHMCRPVWLRELDWAGRLGARV